MSAALALVPASPDLSPARAALVAAFAERESVLRASGTIVQARERLSAALIARTEAQGALNALATAEAEAVTNWSFTGKGREPKPDLGKRRDLEGRLDDARVRAEAAQAAVAKLDAAGQEGERRLRAADEAVSLALSAVLMEEVEAELDEAAQLFAKARARVRAVTKLACEAQNTCAEAHRPRAGSLAYQASAMLSPAPDQWDRLGDWADTKRAVAQLIEDLRTEPTATLSLD